MKLDIGKRYQVKVLKIIRTGIVVQVGDKSSDTAFIHLSRISKLFVDDISKFVDVGFTYEAEAIKGKVDPIELSLIHMNLEPKTGTVQANRPIKTDTSKYIERAPKAKPVIFGSMTLDDMITKMNKDYADKSQAMNIRERRKNKR